MSAEIQVVRSAVDSPDAYDRHDAIVKIDGVKVGQVAAGEQQSFDVGAGDHEVSMRLQYNFGAARLRVSVVDGQHVTVTGTKARGARNSIPPSRYWRLTAS